MCINTYKHLIILRMESVIMLKLSFFQQPLGELWNLWVLGFWVWWVVFALISPEKKKCIPFSCLSYFKSLLKPPLSAWINKVNDLYRMFIIFFPIPPRHFRSLEVQRGKMLFYNKCPSYYVKCLSFLLGRDCPIHSDQAGILSCCFDWLLFFFYLMSMKCSWTQK